MDNKELPVPSKRRIPEGHYVPPPARKAQLQNEENLKERVRVIKPKVDNKDSKKACNDSSLLFQEDQDKPHRVHKKNKNKQNKPKQGKIQVQECTHNVKTEVEQQLKEIPEKSVLNELETSKRQKQGEHKPKVSDIVLTLGEYHDNLNTKSLQKAEVKDTKDEVKIKGRIKEPKAKSQKENNSEQNQISASSSCDGSSNKKCVTSPKQMKLPAEVDDWESLYDDLGDDFLTPAEVGEITAKVGKVKISKANEKYSDDSSTDDCGTIIEIYGFNEEIKTSDLIAIFGSYASRGFNLKWVDDTHALGIFASPRLAEEVLNTDLPMIKTRPIHKASPQSQAKAKSMVLPSALRPKTCTALARRLVSGALGLKLSVTPEQRAAENKLLREARETRKQAAKDRDAAWEGNFS